MGHRPSRCGRLSSWGTRAPEVSVYRLSRTAARGILVFRPGIASGPWVGWIVNHWTTREVARVCSPPTISLTPGPPLLQEQTADAK